MYCVISSTAAMGFAARVSRDERTEMGIAEMNVGREDAASRSWRRASGEASAAEMREVGMALRMAAMSV